jgi:hypothetical protein
MPFVVASRRLRAVAFACERQVVLLRRCGNAAR